MTNFKYNLNEIKEILSEITIYTQSNYRKNGERYSPLAEEFLDWINEYTKYCIPEKIEAWKKLTRETIYSQLVLKPNEYTPEIQLLINNSESEVIDDLFGLIYAGEVMKLYNETKSWDEVKNLIDEIYSGCVFREMSNAIIQFSPYGVEFVDRFDPYRLERDKTLKKRYIEAKALQKERDNLNQRLINVLSQRLAPQNMHSGDTNMPSDGTIEKVEIINNLIQEYKNDESFNSKEVTDGHHTFGELYHHRIMLFCTICNLFPEISWKSKKHFDEENDPMFNDSFIAGINTLDGIAAYHIKLKYWDIFDVPEIDRGPKYDGYNSEDVIERIYSLSKAKINKR